LLKVGQVSPKAPLVEAIPGCVDGSIHNEAFLIEALECLELLVHGVQIHV